MRSTVLTPPPNDHIDRQVVVVDRCPVLAPPKTSASLRDVPLPRFLQDAVTDHSARLELQPKRSAVLCRTPRGTLLRRDYYNREIWKPADTATGLPADTTFHDLRHAFASTALAEGVPSPRSLAGSAQVDHYHRGPVRAPGAGGQRARP